VREGGAWHLWSEDGEVGGIFVSLDAALRFADREYSRRQGRPVLEDAKGRPEGVMLT
jgi:hypothetical protein